MEYQCDWDISVEDLEALRRAEAAFHLLDVREPHEYQACNLGGELVPLAQLPGRIGAFDRGAHIVVHCQSGWRSAKAVSSLRAAGFENVWNVKGGIRACIKRAARL